MSDYAIFRAREELKYLSAYEDFEKSLTDEQRVALGRAAAPDLDSVSKNIGFSCDVADQVGASEWPDVSDGVDTTEDQLVENFGVTAEQAIGLAKWFAVEVEARVMMEKGQMLLRVVGPILDAQNVRLCAAGLSFASGIASLNGIRSLREFSRLHGYSPAALSKVTRFWRDELDLPENNFGKNEETCEVLRQSALRSHWRRKKDHHEN